MNYDKGPQLTAGRLKEYLACIPDNTKIRIGIGDVTAPAHYLMNWNGELMLHTDCYMQNASEVNLKTIITLSRRKEDRHE